MAEYNIPVIVSTHPKLRQRIEKSSVSLAPSVVLLPPLGYFDYLSLQMHAKAVLSDSGTISEESSIMKFPALNLREAHERPESMEEANVMMVGLNPTHVLNSMKILLNSLDSRHASLETPSDYQANNVSKKIARIIQSYTPYVNRKIWAKSND